MKKQNRGAVLAYGQKHGKKTKQKFIEQEDMTDAVRLAYWRLREPWGQRAPYKSFRLKFHLCLENIFKRPFNYKEVEQMERLGRRKDFADRMKMDNTIIDKSGYLMKRTYDWTDHHFPIADDEVEYRLNAEKKRNILNSYVTKSLMTAPPLKEVRKNVYQADDYIEHPFLALIRKENLNDCR